MEGDKSFPFEADHYILCDNPCLEYMVLSKSNSSFELYKDSDLGVFVLNKCEITNETINRIEQFFIEISLLNIHNIAIDLRNNEGGNSSIMMSL